MATPATETVVRSSPPQEPDEHLGLDGLCLHYQPKVDLRSGRVTGVEALVRRHDPELGLLPPAAFLPQLARLGLMAELGSWVLREAVGQAARWRGLAGAGTGFRVWVNLAAEHIARGDGLLREVLDVLTGSGLPASLLGFEVTESSVIADLDRAEQTLRGLREFGCEIALDDFGTGYSSLTYLRRLPFTALKIDRSFVSGTGASLADAAIVEAVVELGHALGLRVLGEGVEDREQADCLLALGVDRAQGYYFARPAPPEAIERLLAEPWCGATAPLLANTDGSTGTDALPGYGSPRTQLLARVLDAAREPTLVVAADTIGHRVVYANPATQSWFRGATVGQRLLDLVAESDDAGRARIAEVLGGRTQGTVRVALLTTDDPGRPTELSVSPVIDDRGVRGHWLVILRDLRRELAERAELERARDELATVLDGLAVAAIAVDTSLAIRTANRFIGQLLDYEPARAVGLPVTDFLHPDDLASVIDRLGTALSEGPGRGYEQWLDVRARHADGHWIPVSIHGRPLTADPSDGLVVTVRTS